MYTSLLYPCHTKCIINHFNIQLIYNKSFQLINHFNIQLIYDTKLVHCKSKMNTVKINAYLRLSKYKPINQKDNEKFINLRNRLFLKFEDNENLLYLLKLRVWNYIYNLKHDKNLATEIALQYVNALSYQNSTDIADDDSQQDEAKYDLSDNESNVDANDNESNFNDNNLQSKQGRFDLDAYNNTATDNESYNPIMINQNNDTFDQNQNNITLNDNQSFDPIMNQNSILRNINPINENNIITNQLNKTSEDSVLRSNARVDKTTNNKVSEDSVIASNIDNQSDIDNESSVRNDISIEDDQNNTPNQFNTIIIPNESNLISQDDARDQNDSILNRAKSTALSFINQATNVITGANSVKTRSNLLSTVDNLANDSAIQNNLSNNNNVTTPLTNSSTLRNDTQQKNTPPLNYQNNSTPMQNPVIDQIQNIYPNPLATPIVNDYVPNDAFAALDLYPQTPPKKTKKKSKKTQQIDEFIPSVSIKDKNRLISSDVTLFDKGINSTNGNMHRNKYISKQKKASGLLKPLIESVAQNYENNYNKVENKQDKIDNKVQNNQNENNCDTHDKTIKELYNEVRQKLPFPARLVLDNSEVPKYIDKLQSVNGMMSNQENADIYELVKNELPSKCQSQFEQIIVMLHHQNNMQIKQQLIEAIKQYKIDVNLLNQFIECLN